MYYGLYFAYFAGDPIHFLVDRLVYCAAHVSVYRAPEENSELSQALSMFVNPKALLTRVIQVATSSNRFRVSNCLCLL